MLDVGAGRCAMSLPLRPPAARIVAVDSQPAMLENSPADFTVVGAWPEAASGHQRISTRELIAARLGLAKAIASARLAIRYSWEHNAHPTKDCLDA